MYSTHTYLSVSTALPSMMVTPSSLYAQETYPTSVGYTNPKLHQTNGIFKEVEHAPQQPTSYVDASIGACHLSASAVVAAKR